MANREKTFSPATADADGICASQKPAAGGAQSLTIAGALAASGAVTLDIPRHVSITSSGNDSGRTFTVTGTDEHGNALTETITGPNTTTVITTNNFKTVTAVATDDDTAGNITVGSADAFHWLYPISNNRASFGANITGAMSCTVKATNFNVFSSSFDVASTPFWTVSDSKTSDFFNQVSIPCNALKFEAAGVVSGASVAFTVSDLGVAEVS